MHTASRARRVALAGAATLLLFATAAGAGELDGTDAAAERTWGNSEAPGRDRAGVGSAGRVDAIFVPALVNLRHPEPRLAPLSHLPELAAAVLALCVLRRLRDGPGVAARRIFLRGGVSHRAPPVGSFA